MLYKKKYLKYKKKYLNLKNKKNGGGFPIANKGCKCISACGYGKFDKLYGYKEKPWCYVEHQCKDREYVSKSFYGAQKWDFCDKPNSEKKKESQHNDDVLFMQMNEELDTDKKKSSNNQQIFYIYTTAIGFVEVSNGKQMIHGWGNLLNSIIKSIPEPYKIKIIHYTPKNENNIITISSLIDKKVCGNRLISSSCNISLFPKSGIDTTQQHILIDMAHLVSYAISNQSGSYAGYDKDYINKFNYIYLGYNIFLTPDKLINLKIFKIKEDGSIFTIHNLLDELKIVQLYQDFHNDISEKMNIYITNTTRKAGNVKFGDEMSFKEKLDFLWEKIE